MIHHADNDIHHADNDIHRADNAIINPHPLLSVMAPIKAPSILTISILPPPMLLDGVERIIIDTACMYAYKPTSIIL